MFINQQMPAKASHQKAAIPKRMDVYTTNLYMISSVPAHLKSLDIGACFAFLGL